MANIKVFGKAVVIGTELSIKEIKRVEAIDADVLALTNEKDEVVFSIATAKEESVSKFGICFAGDSKITVLTDDTDKEAITDKFGAIALMLSKVEEAVKDFLGDFEESVEDMIEYLDEEEGE